MSFCVEDADWLRPFLLQVENLREADSAESASQCFLYLALITGFIVDKADRPRRFQTGDFPAETRNSP